MRNYTPILFVALFLLSGLPASFAQTPVGDSLLLDSYFSQAKKLNRNHQQDSAILFCDSIISFAREKGYINAEAKALLCKADYILTQNNFKLARQQLEVAENFIQQHQTALAYESRYLMMEKEFLLGTYHFVIGNIFQAKQILNALSRSNLYDHEPNIVSAKKIITKCHYNLGAVYFACGAYEEALTFYRQAIDLQKMSASNYAYIAYVYLKKKEYDEAIHHYYESIVVREEKYCSSDAKYDSYIISNYHGLAQAYLGKKRPNIAIYYLKESLQYHSPNDQYYSDTYFHLGMAHQEKKEYELAIQNFKTSLDYRKKELAVPNSHQYSEPLSQIGEVHFLKKDYLKALKFYQKALYYLADDLNAKNISQNPSPAQIKLKKKAVKVLVQKTKAFFQLSQDSLRPTPQQNHFLQLCQNTINQSFALIDDMRAEYSSNRDKQFLLEQAYPTYELGINIQLKLKDTLGVFRLIEQSKALLLSEVLKTRRAEALADISPELLERELVLKHQIKNAELKLQGISAKSKEAIQLRADLFQFNRDYQVLSKEINADSIFQKLNTIDPIVSIAQIQEEFLDSNQVLLEFFVGENFIYAFTIHKGKSDIRIQKIPWTEELKMMVASINDDINIVDQYPAYSQKAYAIYQQLLAPIFPDSLPERLVIIPDDILGYLPYSALITSPVSEDDIGQFKTYDFLLNQTALSLGFSASILHSNKVDKNTGTSQVLKDILAYAPKYKYIEVDTSLTIQAQREISRGLLNPLIWNIDEAKNLAQNYAADIIIGKAASKERFIKQCLRYRIIHIAGHAKANKEVADSSYVAFTNTGSYEMDHSFMLYLYEFYTMNIQAEMVVLSACETGIGELVRGEGIISLARGFTYAGAKSVVTTLWNAQDKQTSEIMEVFYQYLAAGFPKDVAMQKAQQDFIKNQEDFINRLYPNIWAPFTVIGITDSIELSRSSQPKYLPTFAGLLFMLFFSFIGIAKRRKPSN